MSDIGPAPPADLSRAGLTPYYTQRRGPQNGATRPDDQAPLPALIRGAAPFAAGSRLYGAESTRQGLPAAVTPARDRPGDDAAGADDRVLADRRRRAARSRRRRARRARRW